MQRRTLLQLGLTAGASLALVGCGFRLRGFDQPVMAIDALTVEGADSELARRVTRRLERAGTRVHDQAALVLNLGTESFRERRLSVLDSGHREVEMTLAVPFSVQRRADSAYLLDQQRLEVSEHLTVNDDQLLAQDDLREQTRDRLRDDAVSQLMNRLRALDTE